MNWLGLLTPARTPGAVITRLNREIAAILHQPDVEERLAAQGGEPQTNSPGQFTEHIRIETRKWAQVIRAAKMHTE